MKTNTVILRTKKNNETLPIAPQDRVETIANLNGNGATVVQQMGVLDAGWYEVELAGGGGGGGGGWTSIETLAKAGDGGYLNTKFYVANARKYALYAGGGGGRGQRNLSPGGGGGGFAGATASVQTTAVGGAGGGGSVLDLVTNNFENEIPSKQLEGFFNVEPYLRGYIFIAGGGGGGGGLGVTNNRGGGGGGSYGAGGNAYSAGNGIQDLAGGQFGSTNSGGAGGLFYGGKAGWASSSNNTQALGGHGGNSLNNQLGGGATGGDSSAQGTNGNNGYARLWKLGQNNMFIKSVLAKFIWNESELPVNITSIFLENLILTSSTENFCVVNKNNPFFTNNFVVLEREKMYGFPSKIQALTHGGETITSTDFVLFKNFKIDEIPMNKYIAFYSQMIAEINKAIKQHIRGSELLVTIRAKNAEDKKALETLFKDFQGVKIFQTKDELSTDKDIDFVQFEVNNQMEVLERTKRELERDLWSRVGVLGASDKTHLIEKQATNGEQGIDLLNAYELAQRKDFSTRFNKWANKKLWAKIHSVNSDNSINNETEEQEADSGNNTGN